MCDSCDYKELLEKIEVLLGDEEYDWAEETLSGIHAWVEDNEHATDAQKAAVGNIESKGDRQ